MKTIKFRGTLIAMILVPIIFITLRNFDIINFKGVAKRNMCKKQELALAESVKGTIVDKFEDRNNHNYRTILLKDSDGNTKKTLLFTTDISGLYEELKIGDLLIKDSATLDIIVLREAEQFRYVLEYGCKE